MTATRSRRERIARLFGIAVGLVVMAAASRLIRWPAPGIAVVLGFGAYWIARGGGGSGEGKS